MNGARINRSASDDMVYNCMARVHFARHLDTQKKCCSFGDYNFALGKKQMLCGPHFVSAPSAFGLYTIDFVSNQLMEQRICLQFSGVQLPHSILCTSYSAPTGITFIIYLF